MCSAVSFMEVLPKDKKQKEEKTKVLCQGTLDLLPYILGDLPSLDSLSLTLYPTTSPSADAATTASSCEEKVRVHNNSYDVGDFFCRIVYRLW